MTSPKVLLCVLGEFIPLAPFVKNSATRSILGQLASMDLSVKVTGRSEGKILLIDFVDIKVDEVVEKLITAASSSHKLQIPTIQSQWMTLSPKRTIQMNSRLPAELVIG